MRSINVSNYETIAHASMVEVGGEALVLSNCSTHYLVARRFWYPGTDRLPDEASVVDEFPYNDYNTDDLRPAYRLALARMSEVALGN